MNTRIANRFEVIPAHDHTDAMIGWQVHDQANLILLAPIFEHERHAIQHALELAQDARIEAEIASVDAELARHESTIV